ncbi:MAG: hypothetical protein AAGF71_12750 [Pseudomonadota bacterium]
MCKAPHQKPLRDRLTGTERLFSDTGYDHADFIVLQMARAFFHSFACPNSQGWMLAQDMAGNPSLDWDGPGVMVKTFRTIRSMQLARKSEFRFSNPTCHHCAQVLTAQERQLMGTIVELRRGRRDRAEAHALILCEGNGIESYLEDASALADAMPKLMALT